MMVDLIPIYPDAAVAVSEAAPAAVESSRQPQFGMSFEEQQEVLYQTLLSFLGPDPA